MLAKITTIKIIFLEKILGPLERHSKAHHQHTIAGEKAMPGMSMEPNVTFLVAKARSLNCHLSKNCTSNTKPVYKFMMITPLLAINFKATPNGNPTTVVILRVQIIILRK